MINFAGIASKALGFFTGGKVTLALLIGICVMGYALKNEIAARGADKAALDYAVSRNKELEEANKREKQAAALKAEANRRLQAELRKIRQETRDGASVATTVADPSGCADVGAPAAVLDRLR